MTSATYLGFDSIATWLGLTAVILRTVTDAALLLDVMAGYEPAGDEAAQPACRRL